MSSRPERLIALLREVNGTLHELARTTWHEHGLPRPAAHLMREVDRNPGITVSSLARMTGLAKSNVSKLIETLVCVGFVERRSDARDQRLGHLYATDKATSHFHEMWDAALKRLSSAIVGLTEEQMDSIIGSLEMLRKAIDDGQKARERGVSP